MEDVKIVTWTSWNKRTIRYKDKLLEMYNLLSAQHRAMPVVAESTPTAYRDRENINGILCEDDRILFLHVNGELAGMSIYRIYGKGETRECYIGCIFLYEKYRGRGYSGKLMDLIEERAVKGKCKRLTLDASVDNTLALDIYKARGFRENYVSLYKPL